MALATTVAAWVNTLALALHLYSKRYLVFDARLLGRLPRIGLASALMGAALWFGQIPLESWLAGTLWHKIAALSLLVGGGLLAYGLLVLLLRASSLAEVKGLVRRS